MNALFAMLAAIAAIFAPAAGTVPQHDVSLSTPVADAAVDAVYPNEARLVLEVQHAGMNAPALLTLDGGSVSWVHAITLHAGRNTLIDSTFPVGEYTITLQNVMTAGSDGVDLGACPAGTTIARMNTTFETTRFGMGIGADECLAAEG